MDALRCPPDDADVTTLSGGEKRRVALCRLLLQHPDLLLLDEPTNHLDAESVEWLERFLERVQRHGRRRHPRPLLPRQRRASGSWSSIAGGASRSPATTPSWLEQKLERMSREQKQVDARQRTLARELEWVRMGAKARQAKGKARLTAYEQLLDEANDAQGRPAARARDRHPARAAAGRHGHRGQGPAQGLRRPAADRGPDVLAAARRASSGSSGPNGAGKTTLFRMLVGQEAPDAGTIDDRRHGQAELRRPEPRRPRRRQDGLPGDHPGRRDHQGRHARAAGARVRVELQLPRHGPAEGRRRAVGRRAEPRSPGEAAPVGRQRAAARRADQRPGRRHAPRARGGPRDVSRAASS